MQRRFLMTNRAIEIHDSDLGSLVVSDDVITLNFDPAYIHQPEGAPGTDAGTCWTQPIVIRLHGHVVNGGLHEMPCSLWDGHLILNGTLHDNLIPIPLNVEGEIELSLASVPGESVTLRGNRITLEVIGDRNYIENSPSSRLR
jgi:hypothetical protein